MIKNKKHFLISGGGTGGHIFPAIAIADALKRVWPDSEFLFVGARGRMEMEKIPAHGYNIVGIPIAGFQRSLSLQNIMKNILLPIKLIYCFTKVYSLIKKFRPDLAIGTGGYASGPTIKMAQWCGIPTVIQEQNSLPGFTNKILALQAKSVFISFENSKKYFPGIQTVYTGNAIRETIAESLPDKKKALEFYKLKTQKKTVFITGGSLGALAINEGIAAGLERIISEDIQLIWQCGNGYWEKYKELESENCRVMGFISDINMAYAAADIIVTRAGGALFEMFVVGKPIIVLPSPYVAEDHQSKNAEALVEKNAAILIRDSESAKKLGPAIIQLLKDQKKIDEMSEALRSLARPHAATEIAKHIISLLMEKANGIPERNGKNTNTDRDGR